MTPGQFKRKIRSKSTRNTARKAIDIQGRGGTRMNTLILELGMNTLILELGMNTLILELGMNRNTV